MQQPLSDEMGVGIHISVSEIVTYPANRIRVHNTSNAGFTLPIRSTQSSRLPKVPERTRSMACTRLLLVRYSIVPDSRTNAQDSYTTST